MVTASWAPPMSSLCGWFRQPLCKRMREKQTDSVASGKAETNQEATSFWESSSTWKYPVEALSKWVIHSLGEEPTASQYKPVFGGRCCYVCTSQEEALPWVQVKITECFRDCLGQKPSERSQAICAEVALVVKTPPANAWDVRDSGSILGSGRCPGGGHGNPLQYPCLENLMDSGTWWAIVHRVTKSETRLKWLGTLTRCQSNLHCLFRVFGCLLRTRTLK